MIEEAELLRSYVRGIRRLSGAAAASLYVPAPLSGFSEPLLLQEGDEPPVPEFADLERAQAAAATADLALAEQGAARKGDGPALTVPSESPESVLVPLPAVQSAWLAPNLPRERGEPARSRRRTDTDGLRGIVPGAWLGLRFAAGSGPALDRLTHRHLSSQLEGEEGSAHWWEWLFALGGALASHASKVAAILRDPVTGLPDRAGFQALLAAELEKARLQDLSFGLLLINPDEFAAVNERFGREAGDRIVREMSLRLRTALRSSDSVARYGGVIFAAMLPATALEEATAVARKILRYLTEAAFLEGAVRLGFCIGIAVFHADDEEVRHPLDLLRRADQALNAAKRRGSGSIVDWGAGPEAEESGNFDRLSGIFTGDVTKDYRNMVLLWDIIDAIAAGPDFDRLAQQVVDRLYASLKPDRVGLFLRGEDGELNLQRGLTRQPAEGGVQRRVETVEAGPRARRLMAASLEGGDPKEAVAEGEDGGEAIGRAHYAVPLHTGSEPVGCLYLDGRVGTLALDSSDQVFLKALASQVGMALDRARLAESELRRQEQEQRRLRAELKELRQALRQAKLVYSSPEMDSLVATTRRVAPTDATVLITGASGTGKELLARTIHELSPRRTGPMVVVDCGAISTTLIESELFGHEKGAYTGAQQRRQGRLAEAHRGTVLLDEVGELPLEVQSKLLRFVQEKQFTPVGGSKPRRVDVRILAATNRDLGIEAAAGRFREDLYYRLNVVRLDVPPLRDRPDDILHLARHFLETFSAQYHKSVRQFTPEAEEEMSRHSWPGNVRELQNRVLQAVILCEATQLGPAELGLPATTEGGRPAAAAGGAAPQPPAAEAAAQAGPQAAPADAPGALRGGDELLAALRQALGQQLDAGNADSPLLPLGRWLREDLVLEAQEAAGGTARRAAISVGLPETTFRRRLRKAALEVDAGLAGRSRSWSGVRELLGRLVRCEELQGAALLKVTERLLLEEILERHPGDVRRGAQLLGVTPPTFRRRVSQLPRPADTEKVAGQGGG